MKCVNYLKILPPTNPNYFSHIEGRKKTLSYPSTASCILHFEYSFSRMNGVMLVFIDKKKTFEHVVIQIFVGFDSIAVCLKVEEKNFFKKKQFESIKMRRRNLHELTKAYII